MTWQNKEEWRSGQRRNQWYQHVSLIFWVVGDGVYGIDELMLILFTWCSCRKRGERRGEEKEKRETQRERQRDVSARLCSSLVGENKLYRLYFSQNLFIQYIFISMCVYLFRCSALRRRFSYFSQVASLKARVESKRRRLEAATFDRDATRAEYQVLWSIQ